MENLQNQINSLVENKREQFVVLLTNKLCSQHIYNEFCECSYCRLTKQYVTKKKQLHRSKKWEDSFNLGNNPWKIPDLEEQINQLKVVRNQLKTI